MAFFYVSILLRCPDWRPFLDGAINTSILRLPPRSGVQWVMPQCLRLSRGKPCCRSSQAFDARLLHQDAPPQVDTHWVDGRDDNKKTPRRHITEDKKARLLPRYGEVSEWSSGPHGPNEEKLTEGRRSRPADLFDRL